jgi:hypothetical protein
LLECNEFPLHVLKQSRKIERFFVGTCNQQSVPSYLTCSKLQISGGITVLAA